MKRGSLVAASITGAIVGLLSAIYVGTAINLGTSLTTMATVILFIFCPVIHSIWWAWWLVPILNAALYGGIAFAVAKCRFARKRARQSSN